MGLKFKRVLLKLSGEYLAGERGQGFDYNIVEKLTRQICELHDLGVEVGLVLGGGNFFRGASNVPLKMDRVSGDQIGMLATTMNSLCIKEALKNYDKTVRIMTGLEVPGIGVKFNKEIAVDAMRKGEILIFSGGTGNPYFSTDTAAVLRGLEVDADIIIKGTKVDGVYDKDPVKDSSAVKYGKVSFTEALEKDLKVLDSTALALCRDNDLPISVLSIVNDLDLIHFVQGEEVGTMVSNQV